ncbi:unnamed protein product [Heterobilharzia americana]|nr:unnamed protein product [Heterobilharzia americana]
MKDQYKYISLYIYSEFVRFQKIMITTPFTCLRNAKIQDTNVTLIKYDTITLVTLCLHSARTAAESCFTPVHSNQNTKAHHPGETDCGGLDHAANWEE